MRVWDGYSAIEADGRGCVIALGNFDGVHAGHQVVIERARKLATEMDAPLGVALFQPHPRRFFAPDAPPFRIMSADRRNARLEALGVRHVYQLEFNGEMAQMSPEAFVEAVLHQGLGVRGVVTGADFHFGHRRAGTTTDLAALGEARGMRTDFAELLDNGVDKISSTRIRKAIADGAMDAVRVLLGQSWVIEGEVAHGDKRGRTIGFPTANVEMNDYVRPEHGVYAVRVGIDGEQAERPAVANFGYRPTVDGLTERFEIHLFDFNGDLYGRTLSVAFEAFIRPEMKFDGLESLKAQIARDATTARDLLSAAAGPS